MAAGDSTSVSTDRENDECVSSDQVRPESYTLEVLQMIREAQQTHGLRHGDFQRYSQYCARRIRRIRKSLHFPQGTRNKVVPKKVTVELLNDVRYLYLPLMDAERSWAYAMQLKEESNTEPRKRYHLKSKLKKAVQYADNLATLCNSEKCDARTQLEAQAYLAWMKGNLNFEQEHWKVAIELYTQAKTIYEKLSGAFVDEIREVYVQRVEELSPNIRYCAYNIGDESAIEDLRKMRLKAGSGDPMSSKLDELIEKTREKQAATLSEFTWRGRTIPVKNEAVRTFLLSVEESKKSMAAAGTSDSKLSMCETLLKELIEAQQSLRDELKDDVTFKAALRGQKTEEKVPNTVYLYTYLSYLKQTKTVERNLLIIEQMTTPGSKSGKPQDLARLYDIIIQSMNEIPNLPGLDEDSSLADCIGGQVIGYKAFRCFYVGQTYASQKKWKEAVALYERVNTYIQEAEEHMKHTKDAESKLLVSSLSVLREKIKGLHYSVHAASILDVEGVTGQVSRLSSKDKRPLSDRLDEYVEDPRLSTKKAELVQFPPEFQPIPCKPLFFDLALSHVTFPSLEDKIEQKKQAGGITGLVKGSIGWLWGGGKK